MPAATRVVTTVVPPTRAVGGTVVAVVRLVSRSRRMRHSPDSGARSTGWTTDHPHAKRDDDSNARVGPSLDGSASCSLLIGFLLSADSTAVRPGRDCGNEP